MKKTGRTAYLDAFVRMSEKYFTDAEVQELIALRKDKYTSLDSDPDAAYAAK